MRSDLDTARGIFWWAVLPLLLFAVFGSRAFAASYTTCENPSAEGQDYDYCSGLGALSSTADSAMIADTLVYHCNNPAAAGYGPCTGGIEIFYRADSVPHSGLVWDSGPPAWVAIAPLLPFLEALGGGGGGEDPPGPGGDEWTLEDLDLSKAAGAFAAAFMIVAMFWALGKGVGLIVTFVRRM